ncbi:hypothetical protein DHEL01_v212354 [Diaporthe helianthi]|uniref:Heterokaryon incompatibility domain-containing protein n=1 Tax=Diaporthe helianthi TaxID=158607 RepID=A0A2P5HG76_DIAHE|nr:hypothetical protein DHEL01_v212354 [Diaporthe helianthi]
MCIIQGDEKDWKQESMRMFQYYSNAYITMASTFSADCYGGFFSEQHVKATRLHLLDVKFRGTTQPVYAYRDFPQDYFLNLYESRNVLSGLGSDFGLLLRARIYQERLVSPRLLFSTQKQQIFECYHGRWYQENNEDPKRDPGNHKQAYKALLRTTSYESTEELWTNLVTAFGHLRITYPTDKLPAIAAIAKQFLSTQKLPHSPAHEYLCGLRRTHLHVDLSWSVVKDPALKTADFCVVKSYTAPSWSWASVPGQIGYGYNTLRGDGKVSTISLTKECLSFAGDRFGQVLGGYIIIEAPAFECAWTSWTTAFLEISHERWLNLPGDGNSEVGFKLDYPNIHYLVETHVEGGKAVKKLTVLHTWLSADEQILGFLVLYKDRSNGRYRRLGVGTASPDRTAYWGRFKALCQQAERRTLELE